MRLKKNKRETRKRIEDYSRYCTACVMSVSGEVKSGWNLFSVWPLRSPKDSWN